jgi:tRNA(Arg) A34 adenosine deaminase TadA
VTDQNPSDDGSTGTGTDADAGTGPDPDPAIDLDALDHESHVRRALALAREAGDRGDGPYGSLLVRDGTVVMEARNREVTDDDVALHPELTLARRAASEYTPAERAATVMYTSTEPCSMCATGIAFAGLGAVVYGVAGATAAEEFGGAPGIPSPEVFDRWHADVEVVGPVLEAAALDVHREFR